MILRIFHTFKSQPAKKFQRKLFAGIDSIYSLLNQIYTMAKEQLTRLKAIEAKQEKLYTEVTTVNQANQAEITRLKDLLAQEGIDNEEINATIGRIETNQQRLDDVNQTIHDEPLPEEPPTPQG